MKGLILKDFYTIKGYFKVYLIVNVVIILSSAFIEQTLFAMLYPCVLVGIMELSLLSYEEREKWNVYALTLPFTRAQVVASKYLTGLIFCVGNTALILLMQWIKMLYTSSINLMELLNIFFLLFTVSLIPISMLLPFLYKFGAEKGRLIYYLSIGVVAGVLGALGGIDAEISTIDPSLILPVTFIVSVLTFAVSWILSVKIYQKREL